MYSEPRANLLFKEVVRIAPDEALNCKDIARKFVCHGLFVADEQQTAPTLPTATGRRVSPTGIGPLGDTMNLHRVRQNTQAAPGKAGFLP
jgi:hypothetical protein